VSPHTFTNPPDPVGRRPLILSPSRTRHEAVLTVCAGGPGVRRTPARHPESP